MREEEEEGHSFNNNSVFQVAAPEHAVKIQTWEGIWKNNLIYLLG